MAKNFDDLWIVVLLLYAFLNKKIADVIISPLLSEQIYITQIYPDYLPLVLSFLIHAISKFTFPGLLRHSDIYYPLYGNPLKSYSQYPPIKTSTCENTKN